MPGCEVRGRFKRCRKLPPGRFDPRSFRTVTRGKVKVVVGCPKGEYSPSKRVCKVGLRAQSILYPVKK